MRLVRFISLGIETSRLTRTPAPRLTHSHAFTPARVVRNEHRPDRGWRPPPPLARTPRRAASRCGGATARTRSSAETLRRIRMSSLRHALGRSRGRVRDPARASRRSSEGVAESRRRVASGSPRSTAQRHCRARRSKAASRSRTTTPTAPVPSRCRRSSPRAAAKRTTPARPPRWGAPRRAGRARDSGGPLARGSEGRSFSSVPRSSSPPALRGAAVLARAARCATAKEQGPSPHQVTEAGTAVRSRSGSRPCSRSTPCTARRARGRTSRCARRRRRRRRRRAPPILPPRPIREVRTEAGANAGWARVW